MREPQPVDNKITSSLRPMRNRRYSEIPIDSIVVVSSRKREPKRFDDNVRSIDTVGLYKPIIVNSRIFKATKQYELICGEGRLLAYRRLGKKRIQAEIVNVPESVAQLMTLGENIARNAPGAVETARALQQMRDDGVTHAELSTISGHSENYLYRLLKLIDHGEERLIKGVEEGKLSINFAAQVAGAPNEDVQNLLIDALESGLIGSKNVNSVLKVINDRMLDKQDKNGENTTGKETGDLNIGRLRKEIQHVTKEREQFARQAKIGMNRVTCAVIMLGKLVENPEFVACARRENIPDLPPLSRNYVI